MNYKILEISEIVSGGTPKTSINDYWNGDIPWLSIADFNNVNRFVYNAEKKITKKGLENSSTSLLNRNDIIISARGTVGAIAQLSKPMAFNQSCYGLRAKTKLISNDFLYYSLKNMITTIKLYTHGSVFDTITRSTFEQLEINVPSMRYQDKIVKILSDIDKKIELNNQMNDNLQKLINYIYIEKFSLVDNFVSANEIADINIGKTPPRKYQEYFTKSSKDVKWVSISDLGKCGMYILDTSEKLTKEAVYKYNVKIIPKETIILSFKLTIGRVAVTNENMATNEAIAHFNLKDNSMKNYLFCYLKNFDYNKLGNTSSIAKAVNSKIIKSMPIGIPSEKQLEDFNRLTNKMFEKIRSRELENQALIYLRDVLLSKLMSGEINLDNIDI